MAFVCSTALDSQGIQPSGNGRRSFIPQGYLSRRHGGNQCILFHTTYQMYISYTHIQFIPSISKILVTVAAQLMGHQLYQSVIYSIRCALCRLAKAMPRSSRPPRVWQWSARDTTALSRRGVGHSGSSRPLLWCWCYPIHQRANKRRSLDPVPTAANLGPDLRQEQIQVRCS